MNNTTINSIMESLREQIGTTNYVDVDNGVEKYFNCSKEEFKEAIDKLKDDGYYRGTVWFDTVGEPNKKTTILVMGPTGASYEEAFKHRFDIHLPYGLENQEITLDESIKRRREHLEYTRKMTMRRLKSKGLTAHEIAERAELPYEEVLKIYEAV